MPFTVLPWLWLLASCWCRVLVLGLASLFPAFCLAAPAVCLCVLYVGRDMQGSG